MAIRALANSPVNDGAICSIRFRGQDKLSPSGQGLWTTEFSRNLHNFLLTSMALKPGTNDLYNREADQRIRFNGSKHGLWKVI